MNPSKALTLLSLVAVHVLAAAAVFIHSDRPWLEDGQRYEVYASGLSKIDNIVIAPDRSFYISQDLPDGKGQVVRIKHGKQKVVLPDLHRPTGLALTPASLFLTEGTGRGRVVRLDLTNLKPELIATVNKPEGMKRRPDGSLVVSESSRTEGRLVTVNMNGQVDMLVDGLSEPEGIALGRDGRLYVAERAKGRVLLVSPWGIRAIVRGLNNPDQLAIAADGALWITEGGDAGRVLRFFEGRLQTVLGGMRNPQGIAIDKDGWAYVAEQGRDRIIRVRYVDWS